MRRGAGVNGDLGCFKRCGFQLFVHLTKVIKRTFGFWRFPMPTACLLMFTHLPAAKLFFNSSFFFCFTPLQALLMVFVCQRGFCANLSSFKHVCIKVL